MKSGYKIPKKKTTMEAESDDEERGIASASLSSCTNKFSVEADCKIHSLINSRVLIPSEMSSLSDNFEKLIISSVSKQTWAKHSSALSCFHDFCKTFNVKFSIPISVQYARAFATWAVTSRKLKSSTVKSYLSSLNTANALGNFNEKNRAADPCLKMVLKGADNCSYLSNSYKSNRLPMNIHLLNVLGHRIAKLDWADFSKQIVWTACVVSFFSSCRMGELLPSHEKSFDPLTTLTWSKVNFITNEEIAIFVPYTKTTGFKGKVIDIFKVDIGNICPAAALVKLKDMAETRGLAKPFNPVFSVKKDSFLTRKKINSYLATLLADFVDPYHKITGHSFRAAIPSTLATSSETNIANDIKAWGSWTSDCYLLYTKQESEKRKVLFRRIVNCLYSECM